MEIELSLEDLRSQYQWLLSQDDCHEREGLIKIIECLMGFSQQNKESDNA